MRAEEARATMVEQLLDRGRIVSPAVERALRHVPRHAFVDDVSIERAYVDSAIAVKWSRDGTALSSLSQPSIVAAMLELAELEPGHRVLEIGTGTGYNAALVATIVGTAGRVVTIELEPDLADAARRRLLHQGLTRVEVVVGDGAEGHDEDAPYDGVLVTTGAAEIAAAWGEQLRPGGRLLVPVVDATGIGTVQCLVREDDGLREIASLPCGFIPMRRR